MAGQMRGPSRRNEAKAIPVGGHTGETLTLTTARARPNFAREEIGKRQEGQLPEHDRSSRFGHRPTCFDTAVGPLQPGSLNRFR